MRDLIARLRLSLATAATRFRSRKYWLAYWHERFLNAIRWRGYPAPWSAVIRYRWGVWREARRMKRERDAARLTRNMLRDVTQAARMGGENIPAAWKSDNGSQINFEGGEFEWAGQHSRIWSPRAWRKGISR